MTFFLIRESSWYRKLLPELVPTDTTMSFFSYTMLFMTFTCHSLGMNLVCFLTVWQINIVVLRNIQCDFLFRTCLIIFQLNNFFQSLGVDFASLDKLPQLLDHFIGELDLTHKNLDLLCTQKKMWTGILTSMVVVILLNSILFWLTASHKLWSSNSTSRLSKLSVLLYGFTHSVCSWDLI